MTLEHAQRRRIYYCCIFKIGMSMAQDPLRAQHLCFGYKALSVSVQRQTTSVKPKAILERKMKSIETWLEVFFVKNLDEKYETFVTLSA